MFNSHNKIIIVDDEDKDLLELAKKFSDKGIVYKLIHYTQGKFQKPLSLTGVRLAFFDINLTKGSFVNQAQTVFDYKKDSSLAKTYNDLSNAIEELISVDNGPYALIFWTSNIRLIENFKTYVNERRTNLPMPIFVGGLDKSIINQIDSEIDKIISTPSVQLLLDFESKCSKAATTTINEIYKIIPQTNGIKWGDQDTQFDAKFKEIFSQLAISTLGKKHAEKNIDKGVIKALIPVLNFQIDNLTGKDWHKSLTPLKNSVLADDLKGKLNSILHINLIPNDKERGAVYKFDKTQSIKHIICDYNKWADTVIGFEDINIIIKNNETLKRIKIENKLTQQEIKTKELEIKTELEKKMNKFRSSSCPIALEISASCDYSQNKPRTLKYVLGVMTELMDDELLKKKNLPMNRFDIGMLFYTGTQMSQIYLDFNHILSLPQEEQLEGSQLIFSLKKELMDMIGSRYANHISRIGITSF